MADSGAPDRRLLRVLFVHPAYPSTFDSVIGPIARRPGIECSVLLDNASKPGVTGHHPHITFYGYDPDRLATGHEGRTSGFTRAAEHGLSIARSLRALESRARFDVVVGYATRGCTMYLREAIDAAIVSYCEHPGYFMLGARPEFPPHFEQYPHDLGYRAMIMSSVLYSDLGLVASGHARRMFPPELQGKVRVQSEGFQVPDPPDDRDALKERLGLPRERPLVAFFARSLESVRGFDVYLDVIRALRTRRPDVQPVVIGAEQTRYGNEALYLRGTSYKRHALDKSGVDEADVLWLDPMSHPRFVEHLQCLDLAVLPIFEGASNWSFFDAMAAGVPIVASNRSYIPEIMTHGVEGYLHDPTDPSSFVSTSLRLLDNPDEREKIGRNARRRILRHHTRERAADGYEQIIREAFWRRAQVKTPRLWV